MNKILDNALNSRNSPNMLIYPKQGEKIFYKSFNDIHKVTNIQSIKLGEITYIKTNLYYEFDLKPIINRNINPLIEIIKEIIRSKDFYSKINTKIILFKNFTRVKISLQNILRVIIEKYRESTVFIFFTDKYNSIIEPLRSRFLCLRFKNDTLKEKRKIICDNSNRKLKTPKYYGFMYSLKKEDMINIIDKEKQIEKYTTIYDLISQQILNIYEKKNIDKKDYIKLKELGYNILKNNINVNNFYCSLLDSLLKNVSIRDKTKYKLVKLFSESEHDFIKSYRNIIILESLLINVYYEIKDDLH
tara:strand:- start:213 stop:1118 length:906 start_codon:yes stop_codon:yes gene_type:complete